MSACSGGRDTTRSPNPNDTGAFIDTLNVPHLFHFLAWMRALVLAMSGHQGCHGSTEDDQVEDEEEGSGYREGGHGWSLLNG